MNALDSNFRFNFSTSLIDPMIQKLNEYYSDFINRINTGKSAYNSLKTVCIDILKDDHNPPTVEDVDVLNSNLAVILVTLEKGGLNFGNIGTVAFGLNLSGYQINPSTGQIISLPIDTVKSLILWIKESIKNATNDQYLQTVIYLAKLMDTIPKTLIENMLIIIDSLKQLTSELPITTDQISKDLATIGLSFNEDPLISKFDNTITDLFVQKHLVTTKLYSKIQRKIIFIGGYDPDTLLFFDNSI